MSTQKVSLEALQKIRQYIKNALVLPESENHPKARSLAETEVPEPDSLASLGDLFHVGDSPEITVQMPNDRGQWFISAANPGCVLMKLPGLKLKAGIRLVSYLYRLEKNGLSVTWALPEALSTTARLEDALKTCRGEENPPKPEGRLADLMDAIEGDRSPMSFVIASIVRRELKEFGTLGKTRNWSNHRLIEALPAQVQWQWRTQASKDLSPKVRLLPEGKAVLEFFTCRTTAPIAIFQHVDQYAAGEYQAKVVDRAVAIAQKLIRA
jgi:hypothetical protein